MSKETEGRLTRKVLRDDVHDALLQMLLRGRFAPGESLSIDSVARQLGVSPTPVREALVELEHTGLVTRAALRGYTVAQPLSQEQMAQLMDARVVIELAAIERAMARPDDLLPELKKAHRAHARAVEDYGLDTPAGARDVTEEQVLEYFRVDWAFHQAIIRGSRNPFLEQMSSTLGANVHRMRQSMGHGLTDAEDALAEHGEILAAVEAGDRKAAVAAMRRHLTKVSDRAAADAEPAPSAEAVAIA